MGITTSHTITVKNISKIENIKEKEERILEVSKINLENTLKILKWNVENNIYVYRLSSKLIPLATWEGISFNYLGKLEKELEEIGDFIQKNNIRISMHPDHFSVINTPSQKVFERTIVDLEYHNNILKSMGLDERYKLVAHVGGTYGDKEYGKENFINRFKELPLEVRKRIILENDDKSYNSLDVLDICGKLEIPMVLDVHHFNINNIGENIEEITKKAFNTWNDEYFSPKVHFSSPRNEKERRAHSDYINIQEYRNFIEVANKTQRNYDVMLEAKAKDLSLIQLRNELIKQ